MKLTRATLVPLVIAACAATAFAGKPQVLRIGAMELTYDGARWQAEPNGDSEAIMNPVGKAAGKLDPVQIKWARASQDCEALARQQLWQSMYEDPVAAPVEVAGIQGQRFSAQPRCRNAMPDGVVICIQHGGSAYMLVSTQPGCRSGAKNLFTGTDPLADLVGELRFAP